MKQLSHNPLDSSVQFLKGIGEKRAEVLQKVGVSVIRDLLHYYPRRYLDRSAITAVKDLRPGVTATVVGKIESMGILGGPRPRFVLRLNDGTGYLTCVWFHRVQIWPKIFTTGERVAFSGKVNTYYDGYEMIHPDFDKLGSDRDAQFLNTGAIIPLYPSTEELSRAGLDSRGLRRVIRVALRQHARAIEETLPMEVMQRNQLLPLARALECIHFPPSVEELRSARRRLKFEELFYLELLLALRKYHITIKRKGIAFTRVGERTRHLVERLPFQLTEAQRKVLREIYADMKKDEPMHRLLQGDVGSGKTIVALVTMLMAVENGSQAALMAPTEILAEQHYLTIRDHLEGLGVNVVLLIGGQRKTLRQDLLQQVKDGAAEIVIGTHALIQEGVEFHRLGLVVIDEQHRFGVMQRMTLMEKGLNPDVLVMTATPIPRTLSLTLYGDLDISILDELPEGRKPVKTLWRTTDKRAEIYRFVREQLQRGRQAYIVFPLVEESEKTDLKAATESYEKLAAGFFSPAAGGRVALLHGRMPTDEKDAIMSAFRRGEIQLLVCTTVIEVGVDVPNATVMVIENAERFGLTQLHQLRGRVGRGQEQSYCILIAQPPLSDEARRRLDTMARTNDGFKIAEVDLELRGPGEFFGTKQHGLPELRIADIIRDKELLLKAREEAFRIVEEDPQLRKPVNQCLRNCFLRSYRGRYDLSLIG